MDNTYIRYVILLKDDRNKPTTREAVTAHVQHLEVLEKNEQLVLCGPFTNYAGGIVIIKANDMEQAVEIAEKDPFVSGGFRSYEVRELELSCKENNHMGMGSTKG